MKKTFLQAVKAACAAMAGLAMLASCSFISDSGSSGSDGSSVQAGEKAVVTFNLTDPSRTAFPTVSLSAYTYTLTATADGSDTATTLLSDATLTDSALSAEVEVGTYTFTVTASSSGTAVLQGSASATIASANQTVNIKLAAVSGGTGSVSVTLNYAPALNETAVSKVTGALYDAITATDSGSELTITKGTDYNTVSYENTSVDSGATKYVIFFLYDSSSTLITSYVVPVYIVSGLATTAEETLDGATFTAQVTVQKDGEDWTDSGLALTLVDSTGSETAMTASTGTALYTANVKGGTYTVYVGSNSKGITVSTDSTSATLNYDTDAVYPNMGATSAFADTQLILTFTSAPTLTADANVYIYSVGTGTDGADELVDTITIDSTTADESQSAQSGYSINVGNQQLVRVDGNSVYIQPHYNGTTSATVLQPSTTYYVVIDSDAITTSDTSWTGFAENEWTFTTGAAPTLSTTLSVSNATSENSADYFSVYGALFAAVTNGSSSTTYQLNIADGTYYELVSIKAKSSQTFILHGSDSNTKGDSVVIEYVNNNHMNNGSSIRPVFYMGNGNLILENVTFKNLTERQTSYTKDGYYGGTLNSASGGNYQAETIYFNSASGQISAYNSTFQSLQDTLLTKGKLWFYGCAVKGDVDFMWGYSDVALFENCEITCLYDSKSSGSAYLFETRVGTPASSGVVVGKGYVLLNSTVTVESGVTAYFARRASSRPTSDTYYDQAALVNVSIDGTVGSQSDAQWYVTIKEGYDYSPCGLTGTLYGDYADVGWKQYNVTNASGTVISPSEATTYGGVITSTEYAAEYAGRRVILNRKYDVDAKAYVVDSSAHWDIDTLISERGYTVDSDTSVEDASAIVAAAGSSITDTATARTNTVAITSSDTPTGYASVDWTTQTYAKGVKEVSTRADLLTYATAGGYFIIVNGMIDMTNVSDAGTMLPSVGGGTTDALDAFVADNSDYADYASFVAAYVAGCSTTTDDSSSSSPESTVGATLWSLNTAYKNKVQIAVASNTAIVGADASSGIKGGTLSLSGVNHVVIRNMIIRDAYDPFPHHEDGDGYNGERDGITIQGSSAHIWIDHCTFEDTLYPSYVYTGGTEKEKWQNYDGLLDIKGDGAYITASYNTFKNHDKTSLIGSGDSEGSNTTRLITYHHNYFYNCGQRLPMVRNTTLHAYNNYYAYDSGAYSQQYAIGPRANAIIYAENNYFDSGISYAFKGASSASAIYSVGNVRSDGSAASEDNVNYSGVSATDTTTLFSSQTSAPYTYTLDAVDGLSDSESGIPALAGSGDATINGNTYGSSTGSGTTYVTITFNANDGSDSPSTTTQNVVSGTATALTANSFTLDGYTFSGWATSADSTTVAYEDGASITVEEDTTLYAVWEETVYYASGTYTFYDSSVSQGTALDDGTSSDGAVTWSGLFSNGNDYAYTSSSSKITVSVSGSSIIKLTGCYNGTNGKTLTVVDSDNNTIVSGVYTSSDQTLSFLYTGDATVLSISWSGFAYITSVVVSDGTGASESVSSVSVSGASEIAVGESASFTATVSAAYITTDTSVTWESSNISVATVDSDGLVTAVAAGTATITATSVFDSSVSGSTSVEVSATVSDTFEETTTISFGTSGNYNSLTKLDTSNATIRDNGTDNSQISRGYISFKVKSGAVISVSSYSGYTSYTLSDGTTTSDTQTGTSYEYTATSDCTITLTAVDSNNYLYSITITYSE